MPIGFIILFLIIGYFAFIFIRIHIQNKEDEEESEKKKQKEQKEMMQLNLDEKGYKLYKLKQINNSYFLLSKSNKIFPSPLVVHKGNSNKRLIVTFEKNNGYKIWDKPDSELVFLLFNCSEIIAFDTIDFTSILTLYVKGDYDELIANEHREILIEHLTSKTTVIKDLLKELNVNEPQTIGGLIKVNLDQATIKEIRGNSKIIYSYKQDIERIDNWLENVEYDGYGASVWADREQNKIYRKIDLLKTGQEAKEIYYLYDFLKKRGEISIEVGFGKNRQLVTRKIQFP